MHRRTTRCQHRSNHQMQWTPSGPSSTRPRPPSMRCPPRGWQQGRDQLTMREKSNIVWRRAILGGGGDRSGCTQGAHRSANGQGEEQHRHTECGSHTKRDEDECSGQGGEGQRGRGGKRTAGTWNRNVADGRACAWEATATQGMTWPAIPIATGCQGNPCSTSNRWGVSPAAKMSCLCSGGGAHQGKTSREGKRDDKGPPAHTPHQHPQPT